MCTLDLQGSPPGIFFFMIGCSEIASDTTFAQNDGRMYTFTSSSDWNVHNPPVYMITQAVQMLSAIDTLYCHSDSVSESANVQKGLR